MTRRRIAVVGAGGFGREVRWLVEEIDAAAGGQRFEFVGHVVSDLARARDDSHSSPCLGDFDWLAAHRDEIDALALGIGDPALRFSLGHELRERFPDLDWPLLAHPSARYDAASCRFGEGVLLCAGVIATVNVEIGPFAMANLACTLGHEARLGAGCVLNPTVNISGGVSLGDRVLVGTGAQILQYVRVGDDARIGAGAVVLDEVGAAQTVVGVPARPVR